LKFLISQNITNQR